MIKKNRDRILVTGIHRSGSSWCGGIIAKTRGIRYIKEPFNVGNREKNPFNYYFEHISLDDDSSRQQVIKNYLNEFNTLWDLRYWRKLKKINSLGKFYHFIAEGKGILFDKPLLKDPIAVLSAEWLYHKYDCDIVIVIRHPAAFVASVKVLGWRHDFNHFLNQERLMTEYLSEFKDVLIEYVEDENNDKKFSVIDHSILLWNIIYSVVIKYQDRYSDKWFFTRHEDLSINPEKEYKNIFNFLGLEFSNRVMKNITKTTKSKTKTENKRNSALNTKTWKDRLTDQEIEEIKQRTKNVWKHYYTETDWE